MLTVQEIQALTFEKAMFNGYDPKSVDEVIEQITEDYATMQKENAALKAKMKVLVDKIDEYRSVEDGMRRALVSAQGIAQETLDKAKLEAQQIIDEAKEKYEVRVKELKAEIVAEEQRLEIAKKNNADFLSKMTAVYEAQKKILVKLAAAPELQPAEPSMDVAEQSDNPAAAEMPAEQTEMREEAAPQPVAEQAVTPAEAPEQIKIPRNEELPEDVKQYVELQKEKKFTISEVNLASSRSHGVNSDTQRLHEQATARFDFGELKFGADYKPEND